MSIPSEQFGPPPSAGSPSAEDRQWALLTHLSALFGFLVPFGSVLGPLVLWLIKKDTLPYTNSQGKEALNFNITIVIAFIVSGFLCLLVIGFFLIFVVLIVWLVLVVIGTINASNGVAYRYPMTIRFIQ